MVKRTANVLHAARRLLVRCLPVVILAGVVPAAAPPTPAAAGGGPYTGIRASAADVAVGTAVTVTATTSADIGPTPWWSQIYDLTTGTRLAICGSGTACSVTVAPGSPAFGRYEAWLGAPSSTAPPPSSQGSSGEVDVAFNAIDVRLSATSSLVSSTQYVVNLTATTTVDVGPTPYWIVIFDVTTGAEVGVCGSGTGCTGQTLLPIGPAFTFQAFVSSTTTRLPTSFQGASLYLSTGGKG